ncbi:enoyl-CoA hydratase/isomerase family protein [Pseudonocardia xishanensis]|uniref:Enoyl-CoA hydratase/isomerase family protein n=1 Tax=Pseudonocardia xishanensis TaxID=630995 RepID=A0ABP8RTZ0_9PSEU
MTLRDVAWDNVSVTRANGIVELRFHTGGGSLRWTAQAHRDATEAFAFAATDPDIKVLIVTGTGDDFCTEIDTTDFAALPWDHIWWEGRRMLRNLNDVEVPVIGVVNGPATIHSEIPVMADIVLAADEASFADHAHFKYRDTIPGDGIKLVWGELLGPTRTKYWLLTGQSIGAREALQIGFVNEVHPRGALRARAWELATDLACRPVPVLRYAKAALTIGFRRDFNEGLSHGLAVQGGAYWARGGMTADRVAQDSTDGRATHGT